MKLYYNGTKNGSISYSLDGGTTWIETSLAAMKGGIQLEDTQDYSKIKIKVGNKVLNSLNAIKEITLDESIAKFDVAGKANSSAAYTEDIPGNDGGTYLLLEDSNFYSNDDLSLSTMDYYSNENPEEKEGAARYDIYDIVFHKKSDDTYTRVIHNPDLSTVRDEYDVYLAKVLSGHVMDTGKYVINIEPIKRIGILNDEQDFSAFEFESQ